MPDKQGQHTGEVYSDGEFDRAFYRVLGSDWRYILVRIVMMAVVFWLLARAILRFDLGPSFLLLPLAVEVLVMCWLGFLLSRTIIDCPAFRKTSGHRFFVRKPRFPMPCATGVTSLATGRVSSVMGVRSISAK